MTAFARRDRDTPWGDLAWELRSVNHRYLELAPRLPEELRGLELQVRERVGACLGRGKVDLNLRFQPRALESGEFELNKALVQRLLATAGEIAAAPGDLAPLGISDVLRWPGVLQTPVLDTEALGRAALELLDQALEELVATREREGRRLHENIVQRLTAAREIVTRLRALAPELVPAFRQRLEERLAEIREELNPERLEQEIVLFAQKIDVDEELDRMSTHLDEVERVLAHSGPVGRRLDFLMQELHREANTLGSKAADIRLTRASVDLKVLIEQMREQVQNIE